MTIYIFRSFLLLKALLILALSSFGQGRPYTTHTEVGLLTYTSPFFEGITFTARTFHGVQYRENWKFGLSAGVDNYLSYWILPVSAASRYVLHPKAANSLYLGLDAGYGFPWLNKRESDEQHFLGGFILNPMVGIRLGKVEKDAGGFTISVSYQRQDFGVQIRRENSLLDDAYTFHRMALRFGIMF